jgi:hypothetical protein
VAAGGRACGLTTVQCCATGDSPAPDNMSAMSSGELEESEKTVEKLHDLLRLAEKGEEDAVPEIRQILTEHPDLAWRFVDVAHIAEDALIEVMTEEGDLAAKELIRCQLEAMREEVAGKTALPWSGCFPSE